jgi:hypothetical protein
VFGLVSCPAVALAFYATGLQFASAQIPTAKGEAPPDQAIVGAKLGGSFFAPKPLKEKYDRLLGSVRALEANIVEGRISGEQAAREVNQLRTELAEVQKAIEAQKTFVPAAKVHTKSDATTFELGSERLLLVLASKVRIVGWDKPEVKCVLDKTILTVADEPVEADFEQMQVVHEHRTAAEELGKPEDEAPGVKGWNRIFQPLQGREVDVISVKGISHQEGNRQITLDVRSPNGEASMSSHWQRHAMLTVYMPTCNAVAVKGGLGGLDIESVQAQLLIRGDGDRDYHGRFSVRGLKGALAAEHIPLQTIDDVTGGVDVTMTTYLGNSGTRHADNTRTSYVFVPESYAYKNIQGGFRGRFVRADLRLEAIAGQVDVDNEYGKTVLVAERPFTSAAHRIVSDGGQIEVRLSTDALGELPVLAVSESGTVRLGYQDRSFEDVSWSGPLGSTGELRGWRGFERKAPSAGAASFFERFDRVAKILTGEERSPGLDLVNRGGSIQITRAK